MFVFFNLKNNLHFTILPTNPLGISFVTHTYIYVLCLVSQKQCKESDFLFFQFLDISFITR